MVRKQSIVSTLGDSALLLPERIAEALSANDRVKYYFALLQTARANVRTPQMPAPDLHVERLAAQVQDKVLDGVVAGAARRGADRFAIPQAGPILTGITEAVSRMLAPLPEADRTTLEARFESLRPVTPDDDEVEGALIDAMTSGDRTAGDSLHLVVMDAHKALNALQRQTATESLDGAAAYNLTGKSRALVKAFMAGLNRTAPLCFGHPGLGTTATCTDDTLLIQNDIGTTDAHVLVIRVAHRCVTVTYSDIHAARLRFFRGLFSGYDVAWNQTENTQDARFESEHYLLLVGTYEASDGRHLRGFLEHLGSRLVFLIDWNKARKRLRRYLGKDRAVELLAWAAGNDYGHRALLEVGGAQALDEAVEYAAGPRLHYGDRLDGLLGEERTLAFLRYALRTSSEGLRGGRPGRLIRDELKAELARHFESAHVALLKRAGQLATYSFEIALSLEALIAGGLTADRREAAERVARRSAAWERRADAALNAGRAEIARLGLPEGFRPFLEFADDATDRLEEAAALLPLLAGRDLPASIAHPVRQMSGLARSGAQELIRAICCAQALAGTEERGDLEDFLDALERIADIEHRADGQIRVIRRVLVEEATDHRDIFLAFECARLLEEATDCYTRAVYRLRDLVMDRGQGQ